MKPGMLENRKRARSTDARPIYPPFEPRGRGWSPLPFHPRRGVKTRRYHNFAAVVAPWGLLTLVLGLTPGFKRFTRTVGLTALTSPWQGGAPCDRFTAAEA